MSGSPRHRLAFVVVAVLAFAALPARALAHGAEEEAPATEGGKATAAGEAAEIADLAMQPARILAQQALALLQVRGDEHEAEARIEAALKSKDQRDVNLKFLRGAMEALDAGNLERATALLDRALSEPLGATSGKALHEAGREFQPGTDTQEMVGIVAGTLLVLLGAALLARRPHAPAR